MHIKKTFFSEEMTKNVELIKSTNDKFQEDLITVEREKLLADAKFTINDMVTGLAGHKTHIQVYMIIDVISIAGSLETEEEDEAGKGTYLLTRYKAMDSDGKIWNLDDIEGTHPDAENIVKLVDK